MASDLQRIKPDLYHAIDLRLPFFANAEVTVDDAILQMEVGEDRLMSGQLNAEIAPAEIAAKIMPGVATLMNAKIAGDPSADFTAQLLSVFDTGGEYGCGTANNRHIEDCEVATNGIMKNVFRPGVRGWSLGDSIRSGSLGSRDSRRSAPVPQRQMRPGSRALRHDAARLGHRRQRARDVAALAPRR